MRLDINNFPGAAALQRTPARHRWRQRPTLRGDPNSWQQCLEFDHMRAILWHTRRRANNNTPPPPLLVAILELVWRQQLVYTHCPSARIYPTTPTCDLSVRRPRHHHTKHLDPHIGATHPRDPTAPATRRVPNSTSTWRLSGKRGMNMPQIIGCTPSNRLALLN